MDNNKCRISVEIDFKCQTASTDSTKLEIMIKSVCGRFGVENATVSIAIVDDDYIRQINQKFLGNDTATDVISFELSDEQDQTRVFDIVVNAALAAREAAQRSHEAGDELALYALHGLLHNLDFGDSDNTQAKRMHETEAKILQEFGYPIVYNS